MGGGVLTGGNVAPFERQQKLPGGDGPSGNDTDARLRAVELDIREIKTDMRHVATRAWVMGGVLGAAGVGATIALLFLRLFSTE